MPDDRLTGALRGVVRAMLPRVDYLALYPAKVVSQNSDGTLELQPDDQRFPGLSQVPIRYGIPGVKVTVAAGARVLLGFAGGDPQQPVAELWESATVTKLQISASAIEIGSDGTLQTAALGDAIRTELDALWSAFTTTYNAHTHVDPQGGATGVPSATVSKSAQTTKSATVKVKA